MTIINPTRVNPINNYYVHPSSSIICICFSFEWNKKCAQLWMVFLEWECAWFEPRMTATIMMNSTCRATHHLQNTPTIPINGCFFLFGVMRFSFKMRCPLSSLLMICSHSSTLQLNQNRFRVSRIVNVAFNSAILMCFLWCNYWNFRENIPLK